MTHSLGKLRVLIVVITVLLITLPLEYSRGQGIVGVDFVETDKAAYEIGENVNVTTAWHIYYDNSYEYSEGMITCLRGLSPLVSEKWLNETEGYHIHRMRVLLDPDAWNPGGTGENGTIESTISLLPEGGYQCQRTNFLVMRANQNCGLINIVPSQPAANISMISLALRVYNRNNRSFGVGLNKIYFNVINPYGSSTVVNGSCLSDIDGSFVISFDPEYIYGTYNVFLRSAENGRYVEGLFNYSVEVDKSPIPTNLDLGWKYVGQSYNSTTSYALEPVEVTSTLTCSLNGSCISGQILKLEALDSETLARVWQMEEATNASGSLTCFFEPPYEGQFILEAAYDGLVNSWLPSSKILTEKIKVIARELSIVQVAQLPTIVAFDRSYTVQYLVVDALDKKPVPNADVKVRMGSHLLAEGITGDNGEVELRLYFPVDERHLAGNITLVIEASSELVGKIYGLGVLSVPILCRISTIIKVEVSPPVVIQADEIVSVLSQLQSFDLSPIPNQNITILVFTDQRQTPPQRITLTTDSAGRCNVSFRLFQDGTTTIIAAFDGNYIFIASNGSCSVMVLPVFQERLSSSAPTVSLACFLALITLVCASRTRRKAKWHDMLVNRAGNRNI